MDTSAGLLSFLREAHLFADQRRLMAELEGSHEVIKLAPQQLIHAVVPADYIVRRGKIRISQFLPNGREVARAVLQAGAAMVTMLGDESQSEPAADIYPLAAMVLMALGEAELWVLPGGSLDSVFKPNQT